MTITKTVEYGYFSKKINNEVVIFSTDSMIIYIRF